MPFCCCSNKPSFFQHFEYNSMKEIQLGSAPLLCFDVSHGKVVPHNCTKETNNSQQHWDVQEVRTDTAVRGGLLRAPLPSLGAWQHACAGKGWHIWRATFISGPFSPRKFRMLFTRLHCLCKTIFFKKYKVLKSYLNSHAFILSV